MKKKIISLFMALVALVMVAGCTVDADEVNDTTLSEISDEGVSELDASQMTLEDMMYYALMDEYAAKGEYDALMEKFGEVRPFTNIRDAEITHIGWLEDLYMTLGMDIPEIMVDDRIYVPETLDQAFEIGVEAEIANIALYQEFIDNSSVDLPEEVLRVFEALINGSQNHLAAFERGLDGGGNYGQGGLAVEDDHGNGSSYGNRSQGQQGRR